MENKWYVKIDLFKKKVDLFMLILVFVFFLNWVLIFVYLFLNRFDWGLGLYMYFLWNKEIMIVEF